MNTLTVALPSGSYPIHMGHGLLAQAGDLCRAALPAAHRLGVITDSTVGPLYGKKLLDSLAAAGFAPTLITVPAGESSKSVAMLEWVYDQLMDMGLTRSDAVVALGGGVVGDLAGFAAATILRGVDFVQVPTTLLAQVDSSVGGKVGVDLAAGKNLAGAFLQPRLVVMDYATLGTLTDATFADGMAEVIKYGAIFDVDFFMALECTPSRQEVMGNIENILYTCCDFKRKVVVQDERDTGVRRLLNFGHTLGHAYELAGNYETYTHGQGVAAGMVAALALGETLGITPTDIAPRLTTLLSCFALPTHIPCEMTHYQGAIGLDKKGTGDDITLILLTQLGQAVCHKLPKAEVLALLEPGGAL